MRPIILNILQRKTQVIHHDKNFLLKEKLK